MRHSAFLFESTNMVTDWIRSCKQRGSADVTAVVLRDEAVPWAAGTAAAWENANNLTLFACRPCRAALSAGI
jgi:hypothetical protein